MKLGRKMSLFGVVLVAGIMLLLPGLACIGSSSSSGNNGNSSARSGGRASDAQRQFPLDSLPTADLKVRDQTVYAWLARTAEQMSEGLMHVPENEIADDQGMLFIFSDERIRGFWMLNTITSLDIAFARMDGTIVKTWTMPPLTTQTFSSIEPAMFALEMKAGAFARMGVREGDVLDIPDDVFKAEP